MLENPGDTARITEWIINEGWLEQLQLVGAIDNLQHKSEEREALIQSETELREKAAILGETAQMHFPR